MQEFSEADNQNIRAGKLADHIQHMMRLLMRTPLTVLDDAQFKSVVGNLSNIVKKLISKDARFALIITDEDGRTQLGCNYTTPESAARILEEVAATCRLMHEGFIERN